MHSFELEVCSKKNSNHDVIGWKVKCLQKDPHSNFPNTQLVSFWIGNIDYLYDTVRELDREIKTINGYVYCVLKDQRFYAGSSSSSRSNRMANYKKKNTWGFLVILDVSFCNRKQFARPWSSLERFIFEAMCVYCKRYTLKIDNEQRRFSEPADKKYEEFKREVSKFLPSFLPFGFNYLHVKLIELKNHLQQDTSRNYYNQDHFNDHLKTNSFTRHSARTELSKSSSQTEINNQTHSRPEPIRIIFNQDHKLSTGPLADLLNFGPASFYQMLDTVSAQNGVVIFDSTKDSGTQGELKFLIRRRWSGHDPLKFSFKKHNQLYVWAQVNDVDRFIINNQKLYLTIAQGFNFVGTWFDKNHSLKPRYKSILKTYHDLIDRNIIHTVKL